jgi:hypothetical protein
MQRGANTRDAPATKTGAIDFRQRPDAARAGTSSPFHEGPVDDQLRGPVVKPGSLPRLDLLPHRLEVALHAVCSDRQDVDEVEVLGVLCEHGVKSPANPKLEHKRIDLSTVFAGQEVRTKEAHDDIWQVSFMDFDLGYFDFETRVPEPLDNLSGPG